MATTTNFGWETPDDTDLVKDGAAAMRTLGGAIDTSLVDLKGGTTGQVLAKASNTDMDFTWSADAAGISPTIFAAKGDILGASANDTPAITSVGANGETLVADSSTSTGLRWSGTPSASNPVLNSAMQVWQRGTSIAGTSGYCADRWYKLRGFDVAGQTISRQATNDTTNLPNIQYCARVQRDVSDTSTRELFFYQAFETVNSIPFAGKTVTLSFYARAGANYSSTSSALGVTLYTGTGTDQAAPYAYTGSASPISSTATLTTTWQRFTYTGTIATTAKEMGIQFLYTPVGTAGANDYYEVTGVQIDIGSVALPFRTQGTTFQAELSACQRYYQRMNSESAYGNMGAGSANSTTVYRCQVPSKVTMRTAPTVLDTSALSTFLVYSSGTVSVETPTAITIVGGETTSNFFVIDLTDSGYVSGTYYRLLGNNSTSAYIGFSAEL